MVCLIFAISGKTMTSHLLDTPSIKTCFTNIHPLQFITIPPRLPMLGGLPTPLFIRPPTIREGRVLTFSKKYLIVPTFTDVPVSKLLRSGY